MGKKPGGSVTNGKYRYEGPGTNGNGTASAKYEGTRNSIYVKAIPAAYKTASGVFYSLPSRLSESTRETSMV